MKVIRLTRKEIQNDKIPAVYASENAEVLRFLRENNLPSVLILTEKNRTEDTSFVRYAVERMEDLDEEFAEEIYRRHYGLPLIIAKCEDFVVRELTMTDADALQRLYKGESQGEGWLESFFAGRDELEAFLEDYIRNVYGFYGYGIWAIASPDTDEMIGIGGFTQRQNEDQEERVLELGYGILPEYRGRGYATNACRQMLFYAEKTLDIHHFMVRIHPENEKAKRVAEKLGFVKMGEVEWNMKKE